MNTAISVIKGSLVPCSH